ncbi:hypothetical protein AQ938_21650 [Burkholderia pseudomallei]|uniref:Uncharacterized protein n=1 Tax=Burkholderia pseudomallei (strain 1106a) TaxID=357348 RepID=A3P207_BURP0|nr:hypothetical protein BURPS1106A_A0325 [Burkholderia pseudomallei 1106a]EEH29183.1 conserved hypothetical protein [Burkholderia pseudomallei Pakistan 9]EES21001.1 hypothetical protein BURPS1106B_1670 [Burkholderia pseudomallei 1106b]KYZ80581.1 hypothetical protein PTBPS01_25425 [Burkholderia pseudomallei]OMR56834.1 hypothetical protein AQ728_22330 [Burkholderia pseudomallei]
MRRRARMQVSRGWRAVAGISFVGATARQRGGRSGMRGVAPKRRAAGSRGALDERRDAAHDGCACNQLRRAASRVPHYACVRRAPHAAAAGARLCAASRAHHPPRAVRARPRASVQAGCAFCRTIR